MLFRPGATARPGAAVCLLGLFALAAPLLAQPELSPLPPPVTRSQYRARWFDFLSAHTENDGSASNRALDEMLKAARKVGVRRLSDFSRTAAHLGRLAERQGETDRALRAYDAARRLDDANVEASVSRLVLLVRRGRALDALRSLPEAVAGFFATHESRVRLLSSVGLWILFAAATTLAGTVLILAVRHFARAAHDIREAAVRLFGPRGAVPLALAILGFPLFLGFGPVWLLLYWAALLFPYAEPRERRVLGGTLIALGLTTPALSWITRENIQQRSPLFVAAIDLAERREDASAEDGLRQAATVFPEDSDVWFLLGLFAERSGDLRRAQEDYSRAIQADPADHRPILNRGNVRFTEGDFAEAIRDYTEASKRAPGAVEAFYNLSLARGEAYDFDGQARAIASAREISTSRVNYWTNNPTLQRVVPAGYTVSRARSRIGEWNSQPKSRRLPGHTGPARPWMAWLAPWALAPFGALAAGIALARTRDERLLASECTRCGRVSCGRCRLYGDPAIYCAACARLTRRKPENVDIEDQVAETRAMQRRYLWRARLARLASLLLPGARAFFAERPLAGAGTLFLFFLAVGAAILDARFFDPIPLVPRGIVRPTLVVGVAVALVAWLRANLGTTRRYPSGA